MIQINIRTSRGTIDNYTVMGKNDIRDITYYEIQCIVQYMKKTRFFTIFEWYEANKQNPIRIVPNKSKTKENMETNKEKIDRLRKEIESLEAEMKQPVVFVGRLTKSAAMTFVGKGAEEVRGSFCITPIEPFVETIAKLNDLFSENGSFKITIEPVPGAFRCSFKYENPS